MTERVDLGGTKFDAESVKAALDGFTNATDGINVSNGVGIIGDGCDDEDVYVAKVDVLDAGELIDITQSRGGERASVVRDVKQDNTAAFSTLKVRDDIETKVEDAIDVRTDFKRFVEREFGLTSTDVKMFKDGGETNDFASSNRSGSVVGSRLGGALDESDDVGLAYIAVGGEEGTPARDGEAEDGVVYISLYDERDE